MYSSKTLLLALAAVSTLAVAQAPAVNSADSAKSADYKKNILSKSATTISDANKSVISSSILCQNVPVVGNDKIAAMEAYSNYILQVSDLFASNSKDIQGHTIGINQDNQMSYLLVEPISIVGIDFDTVNINRLKDVDGNYYQLTAEKPLTDADVGKIKNIPASNNLTVSTKDKKLSIMCNIKLVLKK